MFESVVDGSWYFDSYGHSGDAQQALMNRDLLHPLGVWHPSQRCTTGASSEIT